MNESRQRYLEDFAVGQTFGSRRLRIDGDRALAFAAEFDRLRELPALRGKIRKFGTRYFGIALTTTPMFRAGE